MKIALLMGRGGGRFNPGCLHLLRSCGVVWFAHLPVTQEVASSNLVRIAYYWDIAQLVERLTVNQDVAGSSPAIPAFADVAQTAEQ